MECYSVLKGREILTHATKWMSLEDIMLSEIGQSLKDKYCVYNSTYRRSLEEPKSQKQEVWCNLGKEPVGQSAQVQDEGN